MPEIQPFERYHTNDSGKTLPCTAGVGECLFVQGSTPEESANLWQKMMTDQLIPNAHTSAQSSEHKLERYRKTSLKNMDDSELAETILLEVEVLGLDVKKISRAIALASELHGSQFRKGDRGQVKNPPYIEHPLRNTLRLIRLGCKDESTISGSVLHDTVEDGASVFVKRLGWSNDAASDEHAARTELTVHIEAIFGRETREIVIAVTNAIPEGDPKIASAAEKHRVYVEHLREQVLHSPKAFLVKISDFIDNATGLYHGIGSMNPAKLKSQATKYLLSIPVFQEGASSLNLPIPVHSKELIEKALIKTERRLQRIIDGWDGADKI